MKLEAKNLTVTITSRPSDSGERAETDLVLSVTTDLPVDRKDVAGWVFGSGPRQAGHCQRLAAAIRAGAVFGDYQILTDVNGKTYVGAEQNGFFHKRHMLTSLMAIGF